VEAAWDWRSWKVSPRRCTLSSRLQMRPMAEQRLLWSSDEKPLFQPSS